MKVAFLFIQNSSKSRGLQQTNSVEEKWTREFDSLSVEFWVDLDSLFEKRA